jgi:ATP-dependent Clp protease ATP-binding subunit ClpA
MTDEGSTLTPRMKHTMRRAEELALARGHDYVDTEHVILALIEDPNGIAGGVMHRLACGGTVPDEVIRILESDGYSRRSPSPSDTARRRVTLPDAD